MSVRKIAIAGFLHESNTFSPFGTELDDFLKPDGWPEIAQGSEILDIFPGLNIPIGGFINAGFDWELKPLVWASAEPAGHVTREAFDTICELICKGLKSAGKIDGVYLDLHGAMVAEDHEDAEAEVLLRVREVVGDNIPIVCSLDFHANISPEFVEAATVITIFRHYPHTDMAQTGARAAKLLNQIFESEKFPYKSFRQLPYLIPLSSQGTTMQPLGDIYSKIQAYQNSGLWSLDAAAGFPPADIWHCGPSVIAYGDSQWEADRAVEEIYASFTNAESMFPDHLLEAEEAIRVASNEVNRVHKSIVLADVQDNPGAGGTSDTIGILNEIIRQDVCPAVVGIVCDAESVEHSFQAGTGNSVTLSIGNAYGYDGVVDSSRRYVVEYLRRELIKCTGTMYKDQEVDIGPLAMLRCMDTSNPIRIVLSSQRFQCLDLSLLTQMGIDLDLAQTIVVKSTVHFLTDFEPIAHQVIFVHSPGAHPCKLGTVEYKNLRSNMRLGPMGPTFIRKA